MMNFNPGKLAKDAMDGLQKAEKLSGGAGDLAKNVLDSVRNADKGGAMPEQVTALLRNLIAQAQKLVNGSKGGNDALQSSIQKGLTLLESSDISTEAVTKLTAELSARIKEASAGTSEREAKPADSPVKTASRAKPAPQTAAVPKAKAVEFSDVDASAYYYDAVQWAVQKGIASGTTATTFGPDDACTRAQTVTLLWRAAGSPKPKKDENPFHDVPKNAYYYDAVLWAVEHGITSGITSDTFEPDATVTRGQVATFLYRNAGSPAVEGVDTFHDVQKDAYYYHAVSWVASQGIASGTSADAFSPDTVCTRGQIVTFLYRCKR